jgi:hypothetical protein
LYSARAADAKEVGVGNPAEKTYRCPKRSSRLLFQRLSARKNRQMGEIGGFMGKVFQRKGGTSQKRKKKK